MFESVSVPSKQLESYRGTTPDEQLDQIRERAASLRGARVLHVNATAFGGGVAEMLTSIVPLLCDVGIRAEWRVIEGATEFYNVTKKFHKALQGMDVPITNEELETYLRYNRLNARAFDEEYDFVVMHDPQPAAVRKLMVEEGRGRSGKWV